MSKIFARFKKNESGATAIEYGLIAAIMAVAVIAVFPTLQTGLQGAFDNISSSLGEAPSTMGGGGGAVE